MRVGTVGDDGDNGDPEYSATVTRAEKGNGLLAVPGPEPKTVTTQNPKSFPLEIS
jgi:hypothetical protein